MQKEIKTAEEIKAAVDQYLVQHGGASGSQWFTIVEVDAPVNGANWRIKHSGAMVPTGAGEGAGEELFQTAIMMQTIDNCMRARGFVKKQVS